MRSRFFLISIICAITWSATVSAAYFQTSDDMPGRFLPGKYFEYKAQFYLKKKDYRISLEMSELASYWANKSAQYHVGIMYFTGTGVAADKARGAAWLRIAAEQKNPVAVHALELAYTELTPQQHIEADALWRELDKKYGDKVTLPRARAHFEDEKRNVTGSRLGLVGNIKVRYGGLDGDSVGSADDYYADQQKEFNTFIEDNFGHGHVDVGAIEPVNTPLENGTKDDKNPPDATPLK